MSKREDLDIELRGQLVNIEFAVQDADPDVGLMGFGFEDEVITDSEGRVLDWELTDQEREKVTEKVNAKIMDAGADYDDRHWNNTHE